MRSNSQWDHRPGGPELLTAGTMVLTRRQYRVSASQFVGAPLTHALTTGRGHSLAIGPGIAYKNGSVMPHPSNAAPCWKGEPR